MFALKNVFMLGTNYNSTCLYPMVLFLFCYLVASWLFLFVLYKPNLSPQIILWLFWNLIGCDMKLSWISFSTFSLRCFWCPMVSELVTCEMCFFYHLLWHNSDKGLTFCFLICKILSVQWTSTTLEVMWRAKVEA